MGDAYDERQHIISDVDPYVNSRKCCVNGFFKKLSSCIEPAVFFYFFAIVLGQPLISQYIYKRKFREFAAVYHLNMTHDGSALQECYKLPVNVSNFTREQHVLLKKVQADSQTSSIEWIQVSAAVYGVFGFTVTLILGAYSDIWGRKLPLILPCCGGILSSVTLILIFTYDASLYFLLLSSLFGGFGGGFCTFMMSAFSVASDQSSVKNRAFRLVLMEITILSSVAISQLSGGYWIKASGFVIPAIGACSSYLLCLFYVIVVVSENSGKNTEVIGISDRKNVFTAVWYYIKQSFVLLQPKPRRFRLILVFLAFFFTIVLSLGSVNVMSLLELGEPLCWKSVEIGIFTAAGFIIANIGVVLCVKLLAGRIPDPILALLCQLSYVGYMLTLMKADSTFLMYMSVIVGCFRGGTVTMLRVIGSKNATEKEQGVLFAFIGCLENLGEVIGQIVCGALWAAYNNSNRYLYFLILIILVLPASAMLLILNFRKSIKDVNDPDNEEVKAKYMDVN